ncbi:hypothetical protein MTR67_031431 [Solanum verrucosum]|uniref:Reverse transcriptase zinc-binding domain-containing protein n=1 Tax=Solanum verrucosum TaxID=315347 RepID=A0AAF0U2J0_SOLVR|nr:hypothetical protein MTR67_031431 [Solanum verrucosum]
MHGRLLTRVRLARMKQEQETSCLLCGDHEETTKHLFFECVYAQKCMLEIQQWLGVTMQKTSLQSIWGRLARSATGKIRRAFLWAVRRSDLWDMENKN